MLFRSGVAWALVVSSGIAGSLLGQVLLLLGQGEPWIGALEPWMLASCMQNVGQSRLDAARDACCRPADHGAPRCAGAHRGHRRSRPLRRADVRPAVEARFVGDIRWRGAATSHCMLVSVGGDLGRPLPQLESCDIDAETEENMAVLDEEVEELT